MDETELEDWFNEEREKLEEALLTAMQENRSPDQAKATFDKRYRALIAKYQRGQQSIYDNKRMMASIQTPIARVRLWFSLRMDELGAWWTARRLAVQGWFFDRKIRRILRDKRDLYPTRVK